MNSIEVRRKICNSELTSEVQIQRELCWICLHLFHSIQTEMKEPKTMFPEIE